MKPKQPFCKIGPVVWNSLPETINKIKNLIHYNYSVQRAPNLIQKKNKTNMKYDVDNCCQEVFVGFFVRMQISIHMFSLWSKFNSTLIFVKTR